MTDLSPATQAVLDAFFTLADNLDRDVTEAEMIAAALRAATHQLGYKLLGVRVIDCSQLLLIADELEGAND
jgi:hypothetical protein